MATGENEDDPTKDTHNNVASSAVRQSQPFGKTRRDIVAAGKVASSLSAVALKHESIYVDEPFPSHSLGGLKSW